VRPIPSRLDHAELAIDTHDTLYVCDNMGACVRVYDPAGRLVRTVPCATNMSHPSVHVGVLYFLRQWEQYRVGRWEHGYDGRWALDLATGALANLAPGDRERLPFVIDANGCTVGFDERPGRWGLASASLRDAADIPMAHKIAAPGMASCSTYPRIDGRGDVWLTGRCRSRDGGAAFAITRCSPAE
jgi:hypothetical protein